MITDQLTATEKKLVKELNNAEFNLAVKAGCNLAKIDRWDLVGATARPRLFEAVQQAMKQENNLDLDTSQAVDVPIHGFEME